MAGLAADNLSQDIVGQTRQVLAKADARMTSVGTDKSHLLMATIWQRASPISSLDRSGKCCAVTAETRLADDDILVEIIFTAVCSV
ncbi:RidA family protein [Rhizobium ruizarguesonis]